MDACNSKQSIDGAFIVDRKGIYNIPTEIFQKIFNNLELIWLWQQLIIATMQPIKDNIIINNLQEIIRKSYETTLNLPDDINKLGLNGAIFSMLLRNIFDKPENITEIKIGSATHYDALVPIDLSIFRNVRKLIIETTKLTNYLVSSDSITEVEVDWVSATDDEWYTFFGNLRNLQKLTFDRFEIFDFKDLQFPALDTIICTTHISDMAVVDLFRKFGHTLRHFEMIPPQADYASTYYQTMSELQIVAPVLEIIGIRLYRFDAEDFEIDTASTPNLKLVKITIFLGDSFIHQTRNGQNEITDEIEELLERVIENNNDYGDDEDWV